MKVALPERVSIERQKRNKKTLCKYITDEDQLFLHPYLRLGPNLN